MKSVPKCRLQLNLTEIVLKYKISPYERSPIHVRPVSYTHLEAAMKQAEQQVQVQQNQLRASLNSEKFKWNNMEYYGPGGRPDDEN